MKKTKLKNLSVKKVDLVDCGADQDADIKITKRTDPEEEKIPIIKKFLKLLFEDEKEEIKKRALCFDDKMNARKINAVRDEIWDACYALQDSIASVVIEIKLHRIQKRCKTHTCRLCRYGNQNSKRAYLQGEGVKRQEWGIHTVIVNKRGNPYLKCLPFVGKVLIDDVWSGGTGAEASESGYGLMSSAISAGLYHPRCKDSHTTYFPGISTLSDDKFSHNELKKIEKQNRKEAKERYAERQAKKFGRLERYSLDAQNKEKYGIKSKEWNKNIEKATSSSIIKDEDLKNIYDYMSFNSYILNEKLRNNMTLSDAELETINRLEKTLDRLSNYKGNLQRSLYFTREEDIEPFLQDYKIGSNIQYKEFL